MFRSTRRYRRAAAVTIGVVAALALAPASAFAHGNDHGSEEREEKRARFLDGTSVPMVTSPNVRFVTNVPDTAGISGIFAKSAPYFYVSSTDSISVYDVSDPLSPRIVGTLPNLVFENEAINYGEKRGKGGKIERFVLVGADLFQYTPTEPDHLGFTNEVVVVDVTDPANPHVRSRVPTQTNTHTISCVDQTDCRYAYTAGRNGEFSVIDLTDLDNPEELQVFESPAGKPNEVFTRGAGHKWNFDDAGYGFHTGSGGTAVFDVSDPAKPVPVEGTNELGTDNRPEGPNAGWNNFIHHNAFRPNATRFTEGAPPSVENGNVLLVTEEDYANDGEELACDQAGTFQTWYVPTLDGAAYRAGNPDLEPDLGNMRPLDKINAPAEGGGLSTPVGGFCSGHWFDYHDSGIVAQGYYQQGMRLTDVRDPGDLKQYGWFTSGVSEVWDAYWVPQRNSNGIATGKQTNIVYSVDLVRGLDVLTVDLPGDETMPPIVDLSVADASQTAAIPPNGTGGGASGTGWVALLAAAVAIAALRYRGRFPLAWMGSLPLTRKPADPHLHR